MTRSALTIRLEEAVTSGAEALFGRQRADGVFAPGGDRFSPANTGAALVALHCVRIAAAAGPGAPGRSVAERSVDGESVDEQGFSVDEQGLYDESLRTRAVTRLCETQRPDGGWAMAGVATETLATAVAVATLQLTAPDTARSAITAGLACLERLGGAEALPEPTMTGLVRQFEALAGQRDETSLPRLPLELLLLAGPARRLLSLRLPIFAAMALGQAAHRRQGPLRARLNRLARPRALAVIRQAYEREGGTGAFSTDPWLTSLITTGVSRSGLAPDIARAAARWLAAAERPGGAWDLMPLDITWSSFATAALLEAGYAKDPRLEPTRAMFHERQQDVPFPALGCPAGYWGFSDRRSWPMALETAEVSSALGRLPGGADDDHARRGIAWLTALQDRAGSWSLAVRDSRPGGFGPCPQMTAKAVIALLDSSAGTDDRRVLRALRWLGRRQQDAGWFTSLWYRGRTPGTALVLEALCRAGHGGGEPARRARDWLLRSQHEDGSWSTGGVDPGAVAPPEEPVSEVPGSVEETAWALHALLAAGDDPYSAPVVAAAGWLLDAQDAEGGWTGSAVNEYVRYCSRYADDMIATGLALKALARLRSATATATTTHNAIASATGTGAPTGTGTGTARREEAA
ncbi:prenyltransferase/squalene oxidase repeat-containing protein [Streptomyces sp. NPDC058280]|uniref:prenyltransferase/squalene oxidase repeat-containing protein n=1 Tax=Streptomyces sp. NPDC058280 TaxID=3346419 RepID=UPI0036EB5F9D